MIKNLIIGALAFGFLAWVMSACAYSRDAKKKSDSKPEIVVSIPPQMFFVKAIGGDRVNVTSLLSSSADPETFEPTMSQQMAVINSQAYLPLGALPFERTITSRLRAENAKLAINDMGAGVVPLLDTHGGEGSSHDVDPHVWSSAKNARIMALNTLNTLVSIDSKNEDFYRANYARLDERLDSIDRCFTKIFETANPKPSFLVSHPSLSYFARDYGLNQISLMGSGNESSVNGMISKLKSAPDNKDLVFFYQQEFDGSKASAIAKEAKARLIEINPMNAEWEDEMQKLYDAFTLN